jgi:Anaphase-promoting complex subunit 11 RING-H2 finger
VILKTLLQHLNLYKDTQAADDRHDLISGGWGLHKQDPEMKVTIRKWNAVATWRWDIPEDDVCGICQVHFDGTCPSCKYPGDDCNLREYKLYDLIRDAICMLTLSPIVSGKCGHNFHMVSAPRISD